jgi:glycosyltransferase involved in cell wall biosynthesis
MNILLLSSDHSTDNYGVTTVVSQLADQLLISSKEFNVTVLAVGDDAVEQIPGVNVKLLHLASIGAFWRWSPGIVKKLDTFVQQNNIQIIHIHGIWMSIQWAGLLVAKKRNIPCVVSAHGMLGNWFWNEQSTLKKIKKRIYLALIFKPALTMDTIFHAITLGEVRDINKVFQKNTIKIIPNAIGTICSNSDYKNKMGAFEKNILFLGRIHPIKGIDLLISAFSSVANQGYKLIIAGPEEDTEYVHILKQIIKQNNIEDKVIFVGPVRGENKHKLIKNAWVVVLPSYSEVMGMVNLEAALCYTPSITTFETGLVNWEESGGMLVHPTIGNLEKVLAEVINWSEDERIQRGLKAYDYVQSNFSWDKVITEWKNLYFDALSTNGD